MTGIGDYDCAQFQALFMAPEQINFGLYLYKSEMDDKIALGSDQESSASVEASRSNEQDKKEAKKEAQPISKV